MRVVLLLPLLSLVSLWAAAEQGVSTAADRRAVAITVYNQGRGLVREERELDLPAGVSELRFADVAEQIEAPTVAVAVVRGAPLAVLEQNYEYDLLSPAKLLQKYVGQRIVMVRPPPSKEAASVEQRVEGLLLSANDGTVWEIDGRVVTDPAWQRLEFPAVPDSLIARPSLVWRVEADGAGRRRLEAAYLTGGLSWQADYVLSLPRDGERAALRGWVTIANTSGASWQDARLKLVAGDLHQAPPPAPPATPFARAQALSIEETAQESLFEYHLYTLPRPTTLKHNQTKQVRLLDAEGIPVERRYELRGQGFYRGPWAYREGSEKVVVYLRFRNDAAAGLGQPLPKGVVRVYTRDSEGSPQFVGEDRIEHTPKDEPLELQLGNAFDIVAERRQTDFTRISDRVFESTWEIRLRNHKDAAVRVEVIEPIGGDWEMLDSSLPAEKTAAFEARFQAEVPAGGETLLRYRIRTRY